MKKYFSGVQVIYLVFALALVVAFGLTQARGMRLLNVFVGGISSHSGHDGPDHK